MFSIPAYVVDREVVYVATSSITLTYTAPPVSWTPRHLGIRYNAAGSITGQVRLRMNGDSGANYGYQYLRGTSSTMIANDSVADTSIGIVQDLPHGTNIWGSGEIILPDFDSTRCDGHLVSMGGSAEEQVQFTAGIRDNTAKITSITIFLTTGNFKVGSTFEMFVADESFQIAETVAVGTANIIHSSISGGDGDLVQIGSIRDARAQTQNNVYMYFNGNTTDSNYLGERMYGHGGTSVSANSASRIAIRSPAATAVANVFGPYICHIPNYADGSKDRIAYSLGGCKNGSGDGQIGLHINRINATGAVDEIRLDPVSSAGLLAGTVISTYKVPKNEIDRVELGSTQTTIAFANIPQNFDHLELSVYAQGTAAVDESLLSVALNADVTASRYDRQQMKGLDSVASSGLNTASRNALSFPGGNTGVNEFGAASLVIHNYTKTDRHKSIVTVGGYAGVSGKHTAFVNSLRWEDTDPVTSIDLTVNSGDFAAGTVVVLRGINLDTYAPWIMVA